MRHRRNVANGANIDTGRRECANRGLTAGARTGDAHIDRAEAVIARRIGRTNRRLLRRKRSTLARAAEAERTRALPAQRVARLVRDGDDGVVEARLDEHQAERNVLPLALLELLVLADAPCAGASADSVSSPWLFRRFLLTGDSALAWALARASVGVGALAANRKRAAMAQTTVGLDLDQALDVERNVLAEVAFDLAFLLDHVTNAVELVLVERANLQHGIDIGFVKDLRRARVADAKDVREADAYLLVIRYVDSGRYVPSGNPFWFGSWAWPGSGVDGVRRVSARFIASLDFG